MDSSPSNPETKQPSRDYKCPCGKTYLSNAAIFTHIRQKHNGIVDYFLFRLLDPSKNQKNKAKREEDHQQKMKKFPSRWIMKHPIIQKMNKPLK